MRIDDLGELNGPVMAFGGPYSNLAALRAVRGVADGLGLNGAQVICTGDVVAYCAQAVETVAEIRDWGIPVVAGNCELQLAAHALDCGCGFDEGTTCDLLSAGWYAHANATCGPSERGWMRQCPDVVTFVHGGRRCAVIHGGVSDVSRFVWPVSDEAVFAEEINLTKELSGDVDVVIAGHSGVPFVRRIAGATWVNAGVIGMAPNDGNSATRYVLLHGDGRIDICNLDYDPQPTVAAMTAAGLTQGYDRALLSGWWPSQDILPQQMRRKADQSCASG